MQTSEIEGLKQRARDILEEVLKVAEDGNPDITYHRSRQVTNAILDVAMKAFYSNSKSSLT